jgi:uncharacterized protein YjiS (DUF1127 family)
MSLILTRDAAHAARSPDRSPSLVSRVLSRIADEIRVRRDLRALSSYDEAALHDIGLTRGGLEEAVRCGRPSGPRREFGSTGETVPGRSLRASAFTEWR